MLDDPSLPEASRLGEPALHGRVSRFLDQLADALDVCPLELEGSERLGRRVAHDLPVHERASPGFRSGDGIVAALRELSHLRTVLVTLCASEGLNAADAASALMHSAFDETGAVLASQVDHLAIAAEAERVRLVEQAQAARAEAEIQQHRLRALILQAPVAIAVWRGPEHVFELANPHYARFFPGKELIGRTLRAVFPELATQGVFSLFDHAYETGESAVIKDFQAFIYRRDETLLEEGYYTFNLEPLREPSGAVSGLMAVIVEVSDQVRARKAAEAARERFALLAQVAAVMGSSLDYESRLQDLARLLVPAVADASAVSIVDAHGEIHRLTDAAATDALGVPVRKARTMPVPAGLLPLLREVLASNRARHFADYTKEVLAALPSDDPYVAAAREVGVHATIMAPLRVMNRPLGYLTAAMSTSGRGYTAEDVVLVEAIAERAALAIENARLFREMETQRSRLEQVFTQAPVAITILRGPDHVYELANPMVTSAFPFPALIGKPLRDVIRAPGGQELITGLDHVYATGEPLRRVEVPLPIGCQEGQGIAHYDLVCHPLRDAEGNIEGIIAVALDVTERVAARRQAEALAEDTRRLQERFRATFEQAAVGVSLVEPGGRWLHVNQKLVDILGYTPEELRGLTYQDLTHPDDMEASLANVARLLSGEVRSFSMEKRYVRKDGRTIWTNIASSLVRGISGEPDHFIKIVEDISARKEAEAERALFQALVETSDDLIGFATPEGQTLYLNSAGRRLMGLDSQEEARTKRFSEYLAPSRDGSSPEEVVATVLREGSCAEEVAVRHFKSGEIIPVQQTSIAIRGEGGALRAIATVARDLREQKRLEAERNRLLVREQQARAAAEEANELKDQFLATVSHELRTPLNAILGWTRMLRTGHLPPERRDRALETVERNARAQTQLIEDLLDISRIMSGKLRIEAHPLDLVTVIEAALETLRPAADAKEIHLDAALGEGPTIILGDAVRLQQVVWNLLSNAIKFTPQGGRVAVQLQRLGDAVDVLVQDSGRGIAQDFLPHVFERFRQAEGSTTRAHGGLGLGLAIVKSLVEQHGGTIRASSEGEGAGATFTVRLPFVPARQRRQGGPGSLDPEVLHPDDDHPRALHGIRVLVVDDEPDARDLLVELLERGGARVISAGSAAEAFELLERVRPDLLVADIAMPGEDGYSLIRKVRALGPAEGGLTRAVALTAYTRSEDEHRALRAGFDRHISKPVDPPRLLTVLADLQETSRSALPS
ncbi:PAS domain-containing protein [Chondromyces crocatus]|uniref:PAS domain-containing protein n=1 Tax=Chondromyces crocatus TaxID=52 RepID=UPI00146FC9AF|nr:PAS domain-containing protein [Chondromyces crocatus]